MLVWYAAYGSNLHLPRFSCYLRGGRPEGAARTCRGARDRAPPRESRPLEIPHRLYFGDFSESWGGGVAFLETAPGPALPTLARIHLVTAEQFEDILAQENGRETVPVHPEAVAEAGSLVVHEDAWYGRVLLLPEVDGRPVLTFTRPRDVPEEKRTRPSEAYLRVIRAGLREAWPGVDPDRYLSARVPD